MQSMNNDYNHTETPNVETIESKPAAPTRRAPIAIGGRPMMIKAIAENADRIAKVGGKPLLTAREVLEILKSEKLLPPFAVAEIKSANGVGDALGYKHLDLPFRIRGTKRSYLIEAAGWTAEEKAEFYAKNSDEQQSYVLKRIGEYQSVEVS